MLAQQREERKREAAERATEREAAERAAERESALAREAAREAAEREVTLARMAHELEMAKLEAARERPQGQDRVAQAPEDTVKRPRQVVMPPFDQKAEDIDKYINQFKRIAAT